MFCQSCCVYVTPVVTYPVTQLGEINVHPGGTAIRRETCLVCGTYQEEEESDQEEEEEEEESE